MTFEEFKAQFDIFNLIDNAEKLEHCKKQYQRHLLQLEDDNYFEPEEECVENDILSQYEKQLSNIFKLDNILESQFYFLVRPSFTQESLLVIDNVSGKFILTYTILDKNYWSVFYENNTILDLKKAIFQIKKSKASSFDGFSNKEIVINEIKIGKGKDDFTKCRLSIANTKCNNYYFEQSMEGNPIINAERYKTFSTILNLSINEKANLLGMPECSVPYDLVPAIAKFGAKNNLASVIGLEHWRVENVSYNFIVTIIPIQIDNMQDALVIYRLKNHYSYEEARHVLSSGSDLKVPVPEVYRYDLINWNNLYFTNFYCYELANILHRSLFVSLIEA